MMKYERWYHALIDRARHRVVPTCYTELHHAIPRSLGGSDLAGNVVRLTYREHFIAHWLLTKFKVGADLRKMQRALFAMTLTTKGRPIASSWQFEAAKRAIRDLELDPVADQLWRDRLREKKLIRAEESQARFERRSETKRVAARIEAERLLSSAHLDRDQLFKLAMSLEIAAAPPVPRRMRGKRIQQNSPHETRVTPLKQRKPRRRNRNRQ